MNGTEPEPFQWAQLAQALAAMPDVIERLTVTHVPDEHGRCRGCTVPGTGRPDKAWSCPLWKLADDARRQRPDETMPDPC